MSYNERIRAFEQAKRELPDGMTPKEYEDAIKRLAERFGV